MIEFLTGKKTYIIALAGAVSLFFYQVGYIDASTFNNIILWLFPAGLASLKAGQSRIEAKL